MQSSTFLIRYTFHKTLNIILPIFSLTYKSINKKLVCYKMSPRGETQNEQMREEAREKITKAAMEVFSDYGYHGATIKQIAKAAGLSYGLVYHYFDSKEEVFRTLVNTALEKSMETINEGLDIEGSAWDKLKNLSTLAVFLKILSISSYGVLRSFLPLQKGSLATTSITALSCTTLKPSDSLAFMGALLESTSFLLG